MSSGGVYGAALDIDALQASDAPSHEIRAGFAPRALWWPLVPLAHAEGPMPYEITVDRDAWVLRVRYTGEITLDERLVIAGQVLGVMQTTGIHGVLLDFRSAQSLGAQPEAVARIVNQCAPHLPADARLAYLVHYDHQVDSSVEDLARSRGYQVDRFHDQQVALAWLQEGFASAPPAWEQAEQGDAPHAVRLVGELVHPTMQSDQVSALGDLVHALVASGMDDASVRRVAGRIAMVMRPGTAG